MILAWASPFNNGLSRHTICVNDLTKVSYMDSGVIFLSLDSQISRDV